MKKLDLWVGEWEGTGWVSTGRDERHDFTIHEKVQRKVGDSVLLIEGRGTKNAEKGEEAVVHEALAVWLSPLGGACHIHPLLASLGQR